MLTFILTDSMAYRLWYYQTNEEVATSRRQVLEFITHFLLLHASRNHRETNLIFFSNLSTKVKQYNNEVSCGISQNKEPSVSDGHACVNNIKLNCLHLIAAHLITSVIFQESREILIDPINFQIGTKRYCRHATHAGLSRETVAREREHLTHA